MITQQLRYNLGVLLTLGLLSGISYGTPSCENSNHEQMPQTRTFISAVSLSSGSGNVVVPVGANYVTISAVGAGGGGGGATSGGTAAAGGGAGAAIVGLLLPVTAGSSIPYSVGVGGNGGGSGWGNETGSTGTATIIGEIVLNGGFGGTTGQNAVGGSGGSVTISGTVVVAGATGVSGAGVAGKFSNYSFLAFGGASGGGVQWSNPFPGGATLIYKGGADAPNYSAGGGASAFAAGANAQQAGIKGSGGGGGGNRVLGGNGGNGFILLEFYS